MKVKVYAKLNLALNVYPKQGDFHPIDSVVTSVDVCDVVQVTARRDKKVKLKGFMPTNQNIAYKTAMAFVEQFDTFGVNVEIQKGIPVGAGMGGSSADAAGVVYCMCKLFNVDVNSPKVLEICKALGSDITYMTKGGLARMQGKGDDVTFGSCPTLRFVLTYFPVEMSTAQVYQAFDDLPSQPHTNCQQLFQLLCDGQVDTKLQNNNLQLACQSLSAYAQSYLTCAKNNGLQPNMTGSGSAYYVWCQSEIDAQKVATTLKNCGYNAKAVSSLSSGIQEI